MKREKLKIWLKFGCANVFNWYLD